MNKVPSKRKSSSSKRNKEEEKSSNQKKSLSPSTQKILNAEKLKKLSEKLNSETLMKIYTAGEEKDTYFCQVCKSKNGLVYKSLKRHIIDNETHAKALTNRTIITKSQHEDLVKTILDNKKVQQKSNHSSDQEKSLKLKKGFLRFIGSCLRSACSFSQIVRIGNDMKQMYNEGDLEFLKSYFFDEEKVSQVAQCYGAVLREELVKDLEDSKFSISIDSSTISKTNVLAMQVRYLKKVQLSEEIAETNIINRIVALNYLEESSTGQTLYKSLRKKLLDLNETVQNNLISLSHDHASSLSGINKGLLSYIKKDSTSYIFDVEDPCHSINLAVSKSLESLPEGIMNFIEKIHAHFSFSPQRTAALSHIQRENKRRELSLIQYVKTRWLSLESSLQRLITIWEDLIVYMNLPQNSKKAKTKKQCEKFLKHLNDSNFKLKIIFIHSTISKINITNKIFQNQHLEVQELCLALQRCIKEIAGLFIKSEKISEILNHKENNLWETESECLRDREDFLEVIGLELDPRLKVISQISSNQNYGELLDFFKGFLRKILGYLLDYLPFYDETVNLLDFVLLSPDKDQARKKIFKFNEIFKIIPGNSEYEIVKEINELYSKNLDWIRISAKDSALRLWDLISSTYITVDPATNQKTERFPNLSKIFHTAHSLATSSSNVEQSFSTLKLFKSDLRSNLKEKTLESLILIHQEYKDRKQPIRVSDKVLEKYDQVLNKIKRRKNGENKQNEPVATTIIEEEEKSFRSTKESENKMSSTQKQTGQTFKRKREESNELSNEDSIMTQKTKGVKKNDESNQIESKDERNVIKFGTGIE